jgi:hypothetical protein
MRWVRYESLGHGIDAVDGRSVLHEPSEANREEQSHAFGVIGADFGHMDTMSLKVALEELGFGLLPDD